MDTKTTMWHDNKTTVGRWCNNQQYGNNDNTTMIQQQINNNTTVEQAYGGRTWYNDTTVNDDEETMRRSIGWILLINWLYFVNSLDLIVVQTCHCLPSMILLLLSLVKFDCCIIISSLALILPRWYSTPWSQIIYVILPRWYSPLSSLNDTSHYLPSVILLYLYLVLAAMTRPRRSSEFNTMARKRNALIRVSNCFNYKRHWRGIWHVC